MCEQRFTGFFLEILSESRATILTKVQEDKNNKSWK